MCTHVHTHTHLITLSPNVLNMSFWPYMKIMPQWKILHNGLMVNKSPNKKTKVVNKSKFWWFRCWWKISMWLRERQSSNESNTTSYHLRVVRIDLCSLGVWLKVYVITKWIMSLRAQAHDILLNHDFHTSVHRMNLWPYMKIVLHSEKYCIMD